MDLTFVLLLFVISRGDTEPPSLFPQYYDYMNEWIGLIPLSLNSERYELFHQFGAQLDRKAAQKDEKFLEKAMNAGARLFDKD